MARAPLGIACNVYVSEGVEKAVLAKLAAIAQAHPQVLHPHTLADAAYGRTGYTLISRSSSALAEAAANLAREACALLDIRQHRATHPRLGVVDHVSCHPLGSATPMEEAVRVARGVGDAVAALGVPVYYYGHASRDGRLLRDVRRQLGYFRGASSGVWEGPSTKEGASIARDSGPAEAHPRLGVATIGATPWVTNFNVALEGGDLREARAIARAVSERGGGVEGVEAMALPHAGRIEVACNILTRRAGALEDVLRVVEELGRSRNMAVVESYRIGLSESDMLERLGAEG